MNEIFKNYSYARTYIDDVIVFSSSFEKHLQHFSSIFAFFQQWNITFKTSKTYFEYFNIFLLSQKIDSFDLITTKKKLKIITELFFSIFLKTLKKYIEMIKWFRNYVSYYAQKSKTLQRKKTKLLKNDSIKKLIKKNFSQKTLLKNFSTEKFQFYKQLQKDFSKFSWLTHFNILRQLYADIDVSKNGFDVMIYHVKSDSEIDKISNKRQIELILFFSKFFTETESRYWSTELKMTTLVWTVRRIAHMIRSSKHFIIIYTNHETNFMIVAETKLSTININKLNMKFIKAFIYCFQFRIKMRHKFKKFNVVSNALSKLSIKLNNKSINSLNIDAKNSKTDQIYIYIITFVEISLEFKKKLIDKYVKNSAWKKLKPMLKQLKKRIEKKMTSEKSSNIDIDFTLKNDLIYHVKDNKRLCILASCEKAVFELTHNENNYAEYHWTYQQLIITIFMFKLSKKIRQYVKYCSSCQLNQTKRHAIYDELISIATSSIFFRIIIMNFIINLSKNFDSVLIIICKTSKQINLIFEKIKWNASTWTNVLLNRLLLTDWELLENIISNRNFKFILKFWTVMIKRFETKLLMFIAYHLQIDEQFEKTNQTIKIILRFFLTANSDANWIAALSMIQTNLNNSFNAIIELILNEFMYDFRMKNRLIAISEKIDEKSITNGILKKSLNATRLRMRQEAIDAVIFKNVKTKLIHDKRYKLLFIKKNKTYLKLHKNYKLSKIINSKLSNQRCESFLMKRRIDRFAYELKLSSKWKIYSVISMTQLESVEKKNLYDKKRSHYFDSIKIESDTDFEKSYEIEKIVNKKIKMYEKISVTQYLIRWFDYESKYDEWKNLAALIDCMNLIHDYKKNDKKTLIKRNDENTAQ